MNKLWLASLLLAIAVPLAHAQTAATPPAAAPAYDVMTIKLNKSASRSVDIAGRDARFSASNVSLKQLLQRIFDIREDMISGIPGPIDSARFDIEAKIVDPDPDALKKMTQEQSRQKLLPLLTERFKLKMHTESKILPVYELIVQPTGPKFHEVPADSKGAGTGIHGNNKGYSLTATNIPMASFTKTLTDQVHRTVIDKTGLAGNYDFTLQWSRDDSPTADTDTAPSIYTALPEQLGLKLQPAKGPVDTLVVDHVEMPTEDN